MEFCHLKQHMKMVQSFLLQSPQVFICLCLVVAVKTRCMLFLYVLPSSFV